MNQLSKRCGEIVKSQQFIGFFISLAIMALISIAFFYPADVEGLSLRQADMQQGMAISQESKVFEAETGEKALWTNSLFGGMPTFQISPVYESNSLFKWIDTVYGGFLPAPANLLFMMMLGFLILLYTMKMRWYFALLGAIAWGFSTYFIIIIGAGHIWKFVALSYVPPTIAGFLLCYRGRYLAGAAMTAIFAMMQLNANHPQMSYYFGLLMGAMAIGYLVEAIRKKRLASWGKATLAVLVAGGLAIGANLPSIYNTYEYAKETKRNQSELTPLPSANAEESGADTPKPTGGMPYDQIVGWSYGGAESFSLLIPDIKGGASAKPVAGQMTHKSLAQLEEAVQYADKPGGEALNYLTQYFNDSEGTNGPVYVGAIIFALFLLGCFIVKGPLKWVLLTMTVVSVLLALGSNFKALTDFMIYNFPMYNKFRAVESILVIAEFCIPLLAIMGLWQLWNKKDCWYHYRIASIVAFGFPAFVCLLSWILPSMYGSAITSSDQYIFAQIQQQIASQYAGQPGVTPDMIDHVMYNYSLQNPEVVKMLEDLRYGMVSSDAVRSLAYLVLGFGCMLIIMRTESKKRLWGFAGLTTLVFLDLYTVNKRYVSEESFCDAEVSKSEPFQADAIDRLILGDTTASYRVLDVPGFDRPDRSYFHKMIGGYHAAKLLRYDDVIQRKLRPMLVSTGYRPDIRNLPDSVKTQYDEQTQQLINVHNEACNVLDMLNTKYVITGDKQSPVVENTKALGNAWLVDSVEYVEGADAEMAELGKVNPAEIAIADEKFHSVLGEVSNASTAGDSIFMTYYSPNTLKYKAILKHPGIGVFSEVYFPWGWKATIDGQPAELARVNYILRAMAIPAGEHEITMTFDPDSIHSTTAAAYACVTVIYLLVLLAVFMMLIQKKEE